MYFLTKREEITMINLVMLLSKVLAVEVDFRILIFRGLSLIFLGLTYLMIFLKALEEIEEEKDLLILEVQI